MGLKFVSYDNPTMEIAEVSHIAMQWPHLMQIPTLSSRKKTFSLSFEASIEAGQIVMHNSHSVQREGSIL
jgi:hypothetical protein